jgi:voltage-gated potassium channel Kch
MTEIETQSGRAIIAGFGLPGRMVAELLESRGIPYTVIETNLATVHRAGKPGRELVCGNASDPEVLRRAGIEVATLLVIAIPDESAALDTTRQARSLNPSIRIVTRTHYTSAGMEARQLGANDVVVEEQAVAHEFARLLSQASNNNT